MRRDPIFWVALAVAFVLGLLPGLGLTAHQRRSADRTSEATRSELQAKRRTWNAEKETLTTQLTSAETSVGELETQVASLTAQVTKLKSSPPIEEPAGTPRKPPVILERSVEGSTSPGAAITLVVRVKGDADKVTMRLVKSRPETGWVKTYALADAGESGGVHTWRASVTCPSVTGEYRYFADAYIYDTHVTMPGVSAWTFLVE